jgi:hypothetical protein
MLLKSPHTRFGGEEMAGRKPRDWRELCTAVTNESDPRKLDAMVQELIAALAEGERAWRRQMDPFCENREAA